MHKWSAEHSVHKTWAFTGRQLLLSSLQEKCMLSLLSPSSYPKFVEQTVTRLQKSLLYNSKNYTVTECFENSFTVAGDFESDNKILSDDKNWARQHNIHYHPSVTINDYTYRGNINSEDIK